MTDRLLARAETTKLARLLGIPDSDALDFLTHLPPESIRSFRDRATDLLFDADAAKLKRVAAATKLVPTPIAAKAAERAFGPALCAAVAASVEPARAVDIAKALPAPFLAEATIALDPRRTAAIIPKVPTRMVVEVARQLLSRGEHVTMGRFVGVVPEEMMRAAAAVMDEADLLRVGYLLEDKSSMDSLLEIVADRLPGIVRAAHEQNMWAEGIDLLATVNPANRARIGDLSAQLGGEVLDSLVQAVHELDAWATLLPVTGAMSHDSLAVFAQRRAVHTEPVLSAVMDVALEQGLWLDLLPLATHLPDGPLAFVADRVAGKPDDELSELIREADAAGRWDALIPIALAMTDADRRRMAGLPVMADPAVLRKIIETAAEYELWPDVLPLVDALPDPAKPIIASCLGDLTREHLLAAVLAATRSDNIPVLVDVALAQDEAGRTRVLEIIDGMDDLDDFLAALTADIPEVVWDAFVHVRDEIPAALRDRLADRARQLSRNTYADRLAALVGP
ncbi:hypothetical protein [Nocardia transvalensis]|uniref:hypothetical protein n=1 Tax=Nocardia transvalensis TaxID=37333 RepID=UPI001893890C|nr:hypothetical protein [Nocardia transvalensis]MBF6331285.1 hypothetical protein [Nocardia transvalensis]